VHWLISQIPEQRLGITQIEILRGVIEGSLKEGKLGVVYPTAEQISMDEKGWIRPGVKIYADSVSSYEPKDVKGLCSRLSKHNFDLILLNCFGFPAELKKKIEQTTSKPII
jgi:protein AroM